MKPAKLKRDVLLKMLKLQSKVYKCFVAAKAFQHFFLFFRSAEKARIAAEAAAK